MARKLGRELGQKEGQGTNKGHEDNQSQGEPAVTTYPKNKELILIIINYYLNIKGLRDGDEVGINIPRISECHSCGAHSNIKYSDIKSKEEKRALKEGRGTSCTDPINKAK